MCLNMNLNFSIESLKFLHVFGGAILSLSRVLISIYVKMFTVFKIEGIITYFGVYLIKSLDCSNGIWLE